MASTNKTANFGLSQYIGTDKPTYLGDYNADMLAIDTAMATNKTNADNAVSVANASNQTAGNAQTTATQAQQTASSANSLAQAAKTAADNAQASADNVASELNLNHINQLSSNDVTSTQGSVTQVNLGSAFNDSGSLGKLYGTFTITNLNYNGSITITIKNTGLKPDSNFNVQGLVSYAIHDQSETWYDFGYASINIGNNTATITINVNTNIKRLNLNLAPCLLWIKDFSDQPM